MLTIELSELRFYANHGLYNEEKMTDSEFEVNLKIIYHPQVFPVQHLEDTIDYTLVCKLIKQQMQQPTSLLETLATTIVHKILFEFTQAEEVKISIKKLHPPIIAFEGNVGVRYEAKRTVD